ncbi:MAG: lytic transglycosylase protein [Cohnella sp.]|nr:lytic transglycosylase protein [Cohnella sp.]
MNVSTDPRIMKQLLLSQWMTGANSLETSQTSGIDGNQSGDLFQILLSQMMDTSPSADGLPSMAGVMPEPTVTSPSSLPALAGNGQLIPDVGTSSAYDGLISAAASKYGLDPALIKGVMQTESSFDARSLSPSGAKGLMQLMDDTARGLGVTDSFDPAQNIDGGSRFLSYLLRKYNGQVSSALAAYNAGPGTVDRLGLTTDEQIRARLGELPGETQQYIGRVLEAAHRWSSQG